MRRKDKEMDKEFAITIIDKCRFAIISMTLENGEPYGIPLSIVRNENKIYFHCALAGMKIDALRNNPKVCLSCVGDVETVESKFTVEYESAVVFGSVEEIIEEEEKIFALRFLCERHTPDNMKAFDEEIKKALSKTGVWCINIEKITGKCYRSTN